MKEPFGLEDYADGSTVFSIDPVCGATVEENQAAGSTTYAGQAYFFCSKECLRNFQLDPGFYIGQPR
jgi:Cu+-exporting ATPase